MEKLIKNTPPLFHTRTQLLRLTRAGSGFYSVEVARWASKGHLELLDLQPEMLRKAQRKLEAEGLFNARYSVADAAQLPFIEDCFDVVFSSPSWEK